MKLKCNSRALLLAGTLLLPLGAGTAIADEMVETNVEKVTYYRTESATPVGAVRLYGSLTAAASRVCRSRDAHMIGSSMERHSCMSAALAHAIADVNIDAVTALHLNDSRFAPAAGVVTVAKR